MIFAHEHWNWIILVTSDMIVWDNDKCRLKYTDDLQEIANEGWVLIGEL